MFTTKESVAAALIKAEGYISGEAISSELNISRAAVNTAVKALRSEGYAIESSTKKGYRLLETPDRYTAGEFLAYLPVSRMENVDVEYEVTSTNDFLKLLAGEGAPSGTVVTADCQTKGKGRRGRSFLSPHGQSIYLSYLIRSDKAPSDMTQLTAWTAAATIQAIMNACSLSPEIKWVNDLILDSRKICGILTEMTLETETYSIDSIIIGIGINVNQKEKDFPEDIRSVAGSLAMSSGITYCRAKIASELILQLDKLSSHIKSGDASDVYYELYKDSCMTVGKDVSIVNVHDSGEAPRHGRAVAVNKDYSLKIRFEDGTEKDVSSGEVSVRGLYGYIDQK